MNVLIYKIFILKYLVKCYINFYLIFLYGILDLVFFVYKVKSFFFLVFYFDDVGLFFYFVIKVDIMNLLFYLS